ncbi:hypothetical protein [Oceaniglobus trochenteri]|uniref:hypothetical protein n=1 Tax=Oceaniglobus trochenteri TaxID=2763260 RepID=UPI001CFFBF56|nr:hypothetical protein [Oceaniglobus trochenteri]
MLPPLAPLAGPHVPGIAPPAADAQSALRARQVVEGHTSSGAPPTLTLRPVLGAAAGDGTSAATASHPADAAVWPDTPETVLTGPRPTFDKTPLEKMRADIWAVTTPATPRDDSGNHGASPSSPLYHGLTVVAPVAERDRERLDMLT